MSPYIIPVLAIVLVFGIPIVAIVGHYLLKALKMLKGDSAGSATEEEARLMQELHRGLQRMEKRIETLEAILLDRDGKKGARP